MSENSNLERAEFVADLLDDAVELPVVGGVGLDPLLGLLPVAGDAVTAAMGLYIVLEAYLADVPQSTLVKMLANIGIDLAVGSIPIVGDLFDVVFRSNRRNVEMFRSELE